MYAKRDIYIFYATKSILKKKVIMYNRVYIDLAQESFKLLI